jgi:hypothetical protein
VRRFFGNDFHRPSTKSALARISIDGVVQGFKSLFSLVSLVFMRPEFETTFSR